MSTFLELCQAVARDSGTIPGTNPTTVVGQTGRLAKIVARTAEAWNLIQNLHDEWFWMQKEFSATITSTAARYSATDLSITDWSQWTMPAENGDDRITVYKSSIGVSDEHPINYIPFPRYLRLYEMGSQTASTPVHYSIAPDGKLCFGPQPDADHVVSGRYRKANQVLSANAHEPECPSRFHDIIKYRAQQIMAEFDEAPFPTAVELARYKELLNALELSQLFRGQPIITCGPLA